MNASEKLQHFKIGATGVYGLQVITDSEDIQVAATQSRWVSVRLQVPYDAAAPGSYPVLFSIESFDDAGTVNEKIDEKSMLIVPK
jgi:hypothetical protein